MPFEPPEQHYFGSAAPAPRSGRASGSALAPQPHPERTTPRELRGHVAVVTGGVTGLGRAIALEFARHGVHVAINFLELPGRDIGAQALLTETALKAFGVKVYCESCDVRRHDQVEQFIHAAQAELGGIHYLVNNAGIARDGALWRLTAESWQDVMDTNVTGAFNCMQVASPIFRGQHYGKVVNVASHQAFTPSFGVSNYAASKAALVGLTRSAAVELGPSNVNVNAVAPGFVRTEMLANLPRDVVERAEKRSVLGRMAEPEDVAHVIRFLCSDEARHITGQVILVDGGTTVG